MESLTLCVTLRTFFVALRALCIINEKQKTLTISLCAVQMTLPKSHDSFIHDQVLRSDSFNLSLVTMFCVVMIPAMAFVKPLEPQHAEIWNTVFLFMMIWTVGSWMLLMWMKRKRPTMTIVQSRSHIMFRMVNVMTPLCGLILSSWFEDATNWRFYVGSVLFLNNVMSLSFFMNIITEEWKAAELNTNKK